MNRPLILLLSAGLVWGVGTVAVPTATAKPKLSIEPTSVVTGGTITATGKGFRRTKSVFLFVGDLHFGMERLGRARPSRRGQFQKKVSLPTSIKAGIWTVSACQKPCRIVALAALTVTAPGA